MKQFDSENRKRATFVNVHQDLQYELMGDVKSLERGLEESYITLSVKPLLICRIGEKCEYDECSERW